MIKDFKIDEHTVKINIEFDLRSDSPDTLYWLKDLVIEEYLRPSKIDDGVAAVILGVTPRTIKNWRYQRGIMSPHGGNRK